MEVQADKGERHPDWFGIRIRVLRRPGVDDVLMNEREVATTECVALQLLVRLLLGEWLSPNSPLLYLVHWTSQASCTRTVAGRYAVPALLLLAWRPGVEKVVHHRDDDGHALHQRNVG